MNHAHASAAIHALLNALTPMGAPAAPVPPAERREIRRAVWPTPDACDSLRRAALEAPGRLDGWLASSLALRDGLSVVEIFYVDAPAWLAAAH